MPRVFCWRQKALGGWSGSGAWDERVERFGGFGGVEPRRRLVAGRVNAGAGVARGEQGGEDLGFLHLSGRLLARPGAKDGGREAVLDAVADAELAEAEGADVFLGLFDEPEGFGCDRNAMRDARAEAGLCGVIGGGEAHGAGGVADFGFAEAGVSEGSEDVEGGGGAGARADCAGVVGVLAIGQAGGSEALGLVLHPGEELAFAEKAAVGGVAGVAGVAELGGFNDEDFGSEGCRRFERSGFGGARKAGAVGEDASGEARGQLARGEGEEEGAVHAAGVGDEEGGAVGEDAAESVELVGEGGGLHGGERGGFRRRGGGCDLPERRRMRR